MKNFIIKNKILFIVIVIILVGAAGLAIALTSCMAGATAPQMVKTAVAESAQTTAPQATPTGSLSAQALRSYVEDIQARRSFIIPGLYEPVAHEAKTWQSIQPLNFTELKGKALLKADQIAKDLFGCDIINSAINFWYYTDTSKFRKDFVKVATMDDAIVCVLTADTLDLIEIDCSFVPAETSFVQNQGIIKTGDEGRPISDKVAAFFGTIVSNSATSFGGEDGYETKVCDLALENGKFVKYATMNDELYAVAVYPGRACMNECVYFVADVQHDPSIISPSAPQNFTAGEPGKGDMTKDEALAMYRKFLYLANAPGTYPDPTVMTFYIDHSGVRENYWHMTGVMLSVDITSISKWLLNLKCSGLWNFAIDQADKDGIYGAKAYEGYIRYVMGNLYGNSQVGVSPNAVYDGHYCTYDATMPDKTFYEFLFEDGNLIEVDYFFDDTYFRYSNGGWKADNTYINTVTGEEFVPQQ